MKVSVFRGKLETEELISVSARLSWLTLQGLCGPHRPPHCCWGPGAPRSHCLAFCCCCGFWVPGDKRIPANLFPSPESVRACLWHHTTARPPRTTAPQQGHLAAGSLISTHLSGLNGGPGCSFALFTSFSWVFSIFNGNLESRVMLAFLHFVLWYHHGNIFR